MPLKKCLNPDCGQEIDESEKVCPKCSEDFEATEAELAHLAKLDKIREARKPKPAPAPEVKPQPARKGLFSSLARKKKV